MGNDVSAQTPLPGADDSNGARLLDHEAAAAMAAAADPRARSTSVGLLDDLFLLDQDANNDSDSDGDPNDDDAHHHHHHHHQQQHHHNTSSSMDEDCCDEFFGQTFGLNGEVTLVVRFAEPKLHVVLCGSFNNWNNSLVDIQHQQQLQSDHHHQQNNTASSSNSAIASNSGILMRPLVLTRSQLERLHARQRAVLHAKVKLRTIAEATTPSSSSSASLASLASGSNHGDAAATAAAAEINANRAQMKNAGLPTAQGPGQTDSGGGPRLGATNEDARQIAAELVQSTLSQSLSATTEGAVSEFGAHFFPRAAEQALQHHHSSSDHQRSHLHHTWATTIFLDPSKPGEAYTYKFYVDGEWAQHVRSRHRVPDGHGGYNHMFTVPAFDTNSASSGNGNSANSAGKNVATGSVLLAPKTRLGVDPSMTLTPSVSTENASADWSEISPTDLASSASLQTTQSRLIRELISNQGTEELGLMLQFKQREERAIRFRKHYASLSPDAKNALLGKLAHEFRYTDAELSRIESTLAQVLDPKNDDGGSNSPTTTAASLRHHALALAARDALHIFAPAYDNMFDSIASSEGGVKFLVSFRADLLSHIRALKQQLRKSASIAKPTIAVAAAAAAPSPPNTPPSPSQDEASTVAELDLLSNSLMRKLSSWFIVDILQIRAIAPSDSPILKRYVIEHEAVHPFSSWADFTRRIDGHCRRTFGLFHPSMPLMPLVFLEVALTQGLASNVHHILNGEEEGSVATRNTATFYSINATQDGLSGMDLAGHMIYRAMTKLQAEGWMMPALHQAIDSPTSSGRDSPASVTSNSSDLAHDSPIPSPDLRKRFTRKLSMSGSQDLVIYATLSPIPGFGNWLRAEFDASAPSLAISAADEDMATLRSLALKRGAVAAEVSSSLLLKTMLAGNFASDAELSAALERPMLRLCLHYLLDVKQGKKTADPVANFHMGNGAVLERLNWGAWLSPKGLRQSFGIMANYRYSGDVSAITKRVKEYKSDGVVHAAPSLARWKSLRDVFRATAKFILRTGSQHSPLMSVSSGTALIAETDSDEAPRLSAVVEPPTSTLQSA
ncbi:hypothetical protein CAOG_08538 [Capsaspora owczarzaki ATCC 30864]|uniref:hypothetical protein n=1 Tax=Capsaspora owczarzaki (strain ATCC 30864) TaxID=595528 RepID=UPI0003522EF5|nr:hypothetical protein CAOG_08538 [Capsaspora owczarzaki ATCC 30864]|eukprot:XP_011270119.1 hypothetical protein CAOG_08538 [Capsaspora owczarzaki ATCC 30864]